MTLLYVLAERHIAEALRRGELANLPGEGMPLDLDEAPFVGSGWRNADRILRDAGFAPRALALRCAISALRAELAAAPEGADRARLRRELARLLLPRPISCVRYRCAHPCVP